MDFRGESADLFLEFTNDEGMHVLVVRACEVIGIGGFGRDVAEGGHQLFAFGGGENALLRQGAGKGLRALTIREDQFAVEAQRAREPLEDFGRTGFESAPPEFHGYFCSIARTLMGRPIRLINPRASFWS